MSPRQMYWACQVGGWCGWFTVNLGLNLLGKPPSWTIAAYLGGIAVGGLLGTHGFRTLAKRRGWGDLPIRRQAPLALLAVLLIGGVVGPASVWLSQMLDPATAAAQREQIAAAIAAGDLAPTVWLLPYVLTALNVMVYTAAWMLIYVGVHVSRRAAEAEADKLRLDRDRLQTEVALTAARMRALEYQLNPHFLFNALNTVRALVHTDVAGADRAVTKLSGLLRRTLAAGREVAHPLADELDLVRTYLDLEALRFGDRLAVRLDADPALLDAPVPALLVQTLVENAVKHGVARQPGHGEVAIRAFACPHPRALGGAGDRSGDGLCLRIENPVGADDAPPADGEKLGLANARERLALLYGDAAALTLDREGDRIVAEVRIPLEAPEAARAAADRDGPMSEDVALPLDRESWRG